MSDGEKYFQMEKRIIHLKSELEAYKDKIEEFKRSYSMNEENDHNVKTVDKNIFTELIAKYDKWTESIQLEIKTLDEEMAKLKVQNRKVEEKLNNTEKEKKLVANKLEACEQEITMLIDELTDYKDQSNQLKLENKKLKQQNLNHELKNNLHIEMDRNFKSLQVEVESFKKWIEKIFLMENESNTVKNQLVLKISDLQKSSQLQQSEINLIKDHVIELTEKFEAIERSLFKLLAKGSQTYSEKQIDESSSRIEKMSNEIESLSRYLNGSTESSSTNDMLKQVKNLLVTFGDKLNTLETRYEQKEQIVSERDSMTNYNRPSKNESVSQSFSKTNVRKKSDYSTLNDLLKNDNKSSIVVQPVQRQGKHTKGHSFRNQQNLEQWSITPKATNTMNSVSIHQIEGTESNPSIES